MYTVKACVFSCKSRYSVYFRIIRELGAGCFICFRIEYVVRYRALYRTVKNHNEMKSCTFIFEFCVITMSLAS